MKTITLSLISIVMLSINLVYPDFVKSNNESEESLGVPNPDDLTRDSLINSIAAEEAAFGTAHCFCRIGPNKGSRLNSYPYAIYDIGTLKRYRGVDPDKRKNEADCGRLCSKAASDWARNKTNDQLCQYAKKIGTNDIVAYSKVGVKKWTVRQTIRKVNCCVKGGNVTCPSGWTYDNNPKKCKIQVCKTKSNTSNGGLTHNGKPWGFIYNNHIYQMIEPTRAPISYYSCN